jgi:hypothetical protein
MDILLIGGLWLRGSAWDAVVPALEKLGHRPVPVTLPGQGDDQVPELSRARHVNFASLDSGHWPMLTRPVELAEILATVV